MGGGCEDGWSSTGIAWSVEPHNVMDVDGYCKAFTADVE
jgi:hypothetical protein